MSDLFMLLIVVAQTHFIRYGDYRSNTSVITFKDYWKSGNGWPVSLTYTAWFIWFYILKMQ